MRKLLLASAIAFASPSFAGGFAEPVVAPMPLAPTTAHVKQYHEGNPRPQPKPEPKPPVIDNPDPVVEKDVCDGGARACRDGEAPTGTESDPTKYIRG